MKKFKFKFSAVQKVRKSREEDALRNLGAAQRAYQSELGVKASLLSDLQLALERREKLGVEAVGILSFQLEQNFINGTKQRIIRQDQAIVRASRVVEKCLRAYLVCRRDTKMIETLREKEYAEFKKLVAKKEQKELDELSAMRFGRAERDGSSEDIAS
jgi:flagellar FliJ protein